MSHLVALPQPATAPREEPGPIGPIAEEFSRLLPDLPAPAAAAGRRLIEAAERAALLAEALGAALDRLARGIAVYDDAGQLVAANAALKAMVGQQAGLRMGGGEIWCDAPEADRALAVALGAAARTARGSIALLPDVTAFAIDRPGRAPLVVQAVPVAEVPPMQPERETGFTGAVLVVTDPSRRPAPSSLLIQRTLRLSATEAHLAAAVARGETASAYAKLRRLTPGTVRRRLAAVRRKTGMRRDTDLVAMLGRLAA